MFGSNIGNLPPIPPPPPPPSWHAAVSIPVTCISVPCALPPLLPALRKKVYRQRETKSSLRAVVVTEGQFYLKRQRMRKVKFCLGLVVVIVFFLLNYVWVSSVSPGKLKGPDVIKQGLAVEVTI
jgi:hypothetical protein